MANTITPESIMKLTERLVEEATVREAVFTNTTPLWIGDAFGHTITEHGPHPVAVPTAKAIIGRARWVIKTVADIAMKTYDLTIAEEFASRLFGKTFGGAEASKYRLIIEPLEVCGDSRLYLSSDDISTLLNPLRELPDKTSLNKDNIKCFQEMMRALQCYGYSELLKEMNEHNLATIVESECGKIVDKLRNDERCSANTRCAPCGFIDHILKKVKSGDDLKRRYLILTTVPRYYFVTHGLIASRTKDVCRNSEYNKECVIDVIEEVLYRSQPLPPKCVKFRVRLLRRTRTTALEDRAAWGSTYLALTLYGIGKASSRGFGKFGETTDTGTIKVNDENVMQHLHHICEYVTRLEGKDGRTNEICTKGLTTLLDRVLHPCPIPPHLWPLIRKKGAITNLVRSGNAGRTVLAHNIPAITRKKAPTSVEGVLSALGHATLKTIWKMYKGRTTRGGRYFHTWVLGLPRFAKAFNRLTGYVLEPNKQGTEENRRREHAEDEGEKGRRASSIILTPIPINRGGGRGYGAVLIKTVVTDADLDLDLITTHAPGAGKGELHRYGYHRRNRGRSFYEDKPVKELMKAVEYPAPQGLVWRFHRSGELVEVALGWIAYLLS